MILNAVVASFLLGVLYFVLPKSSEAVSEAFFATHPTVIFGSVLIMLIAIFAVFGSPRNA